MEDDKTEKNLKYMCHTTKNLDMIRVFLKNAQDEKNSESGIVLLFHAGDHVSYIFSHSTISVFMDIFKL